ncbi:hypothetical protein LY76DRAFT_610288 [Colletotrichum caudatum]|nr:hypothetical protein LY76DRAFT_610288 [Colletotrichum caudatum]
MFSKIATALHIISTVVILIFTVRVLQDKVNETKGIVQILVPDVVGSIATAVKSAASGVVTAAVASGESLVAATLPSSVSVGTKYACVDSQCAAIPGSAIALVRDLAPFLPSPREIENLQELVDKCPNLETVLSAGLGLVLASSILLLAGLKIRLLSFVSFGLSIVAVVLFAIVTGFAVSLYSTSQAVADALGVKASRGDIFGVSVGDLTASLVMWVGGTSDKTFDELKRIACRDTDIHPSEITNDAPVVTSQRTLETTLACLGIPAERVRSARHSREKLAALIDCQAAGSVEQHESSKRSTADTSKWRSTANELQYVIDRIDSSIQRLNHQWQILDDAQKRLENLSFLPSDEVDWDDPAERIRSEEALFAPEE